MLINCIWDINIKIYDKNTYLNKKIIDCCLKFILFILN